MSKIELNRIYNEDCLEFIKKIPDNYIDAIITDPPFAFAGGFSNGQSGSSDPQFFEFWWKAICVELSRILKPEASGFFWCDWKTVKIFADGFNVNKQTYDKYKISQVIYHYREMPGMGRPFRNSVDLIAYLKGPKCKSEKIPNTTHNFISKYWYYGKHENHPSEKDVEIIKMLIDWCSHEDDIIIDPFSGGGSVAIGCVEKNRNFIAIEKECDFFESSNNRLNKAKDDKKLFTQ